MVNSPSSWSNVVSGIPQGSVLGPVLFFIFINDLPNYVECLDEIFGDDTKLYFTANCPTDCNLIQHDIHQMNKLSDCWLFVSNAKKCKVIHYSNSNSHNQYDLKALDGSTSILEEVQNECYLGITFDSNMSFKEHITQIANKANYVIGMIKRTFQHMDEKIFLHHYKTLIRPIVEYGNDIWCPHLMKDIAAIEKIQHSATKIVLTLRYLPYKEILQRLYLTTLEVRQQHIDLLQTYGIDEI